MTDQESCTEIANPATPNVMAQVNDAREWLTQYARMNAELLQTALKSAAPLMTAWGNWYQSFLPVRMKVAAKPGVSPRSPGASSPSCCEIPETDCPPRCPCTVRWDAGAGERRVASIKIRNTSKDAVTYTLSAKPFESCGKTA